MASTLSLLDAALLLSTAMKFKLKAQSHATVLALDLKIESEMLHAA